MIDEGFLTTNDVLKYLKVNLRTIYRLIKAGKIPAVRVGRQWRFRKSDIDSWLELERSHRNPPGISPPSPVQPATSNGRPRILVVNGQDGIRDLISETLNPDKYAVDTVEDGRVALERIQLIEYDLLITDLMIPGANGLTMIREAKRLKAGLPIIIITGFPSEKSAIEAANLGVSGYFTKPLDVSKVLPVVTGVLGV